MTHLLIASTFPQQLLDLLHTENNKHQKMLKVHDKSHTDTTRLLLSLPSVCYEQPRAAGRHATTPTAPLLKRLVWSRLSLSASSSSTGKKNQKKQTYILSHGQSGAQTPLSLSAVWK